MHFWSALLCLHCSLLFLGPLCNLWFFFWVQVNYLADCSLEIFDDPSAVALVEVLVCWVHWFLFFLKFFFFWFWKFEFLGMFLNFLCKSILVQTANVQWNFSFSLKFLCYWIFFFSTFQWIFNLCKMIWKRLNLHFLFQIFKRLISL